MRVALCYQRVEPERGGAETYIADLCRALTNAGHRIDLFAERWSQAALTESVRTHRIETHGPGSLARLWNFAKACERALADSRRDFDISVGFINTWGQDILIPQGGVRAASLEANARRYTAGVPRTAYRLAKQSNLKWWVYQQIEKRQYDPRRAAHVIAVSQMVRGHVQQHHRVPATRVHVIPNAIDAARLEVVDRQAARLACRAALGIDDATPLALFMGHNYRLKGLGPLIDALARQRGRAAHVVVCGGGHARPFEQLARARGVADRVRFVGFTPDVRPYFHGADFFVLPTYYDPCSLVVFEALACGLPVVTTRCNGASELLTQGREGFIVESPDEVGGLAEAIDALGDDAFRATASASALVLGQYQSFDRHVERLLEVAEIVAAERRAKGTPHGMRRHHSAGQSI